MTPDQRAVLNRIIASPNDDMPRLAYADILQDLPDPTECTDCDGNGKRVFADASGDMDYEPCKTCSGYGRVIRGYTRRSEFIRVQCEIAELQRRNDEMSKAGISHFDRDRVQLERDLRRLEKRELELWNGDFHGSPWNVQSQIHTELLHKIWVTIPQRKRDNIPPVDLPYGTVERGFIREFHCKMDQWLKNGRSIYADHPVQRVVITDKDPLYDSDPMPAYHWGASRGLDDLMWPYVLPPQVLAYGSEIHRGLAGGFIDADGARAWLSDRCIETAREPSSVT